MDGNSLTQTGPRRHRARAHSDTRRPLRSQPAVCTAGPFAAPKPRSAPHRCLHFDSIRRVSIRRVAAWFTQLTGTAQTSSSVRALAVLVRLRLAGLHLRLRLRLLISPHSRCPGVNPRSRTSTLDSSTTTACPRSPIPAPRRAR